MHQLEGMSYKQWELGNFHIWRLKKLATERLATKKYGD